VKIDTVRAFYFGTSYLVEVDIVLPENMVLKEAHDIGESLQKKIEDLPDVERVCLKLFLFFFNSPFF
jgi:divalent metal cation (Fe/Co/Zn/Cd) transporter